MPAPAGGAKAAHVTAVEDVLRVEEGRKLLGEWIRIRDPSGRSLHQHLVNLLPGAIGDWPQLVQQDATLNPPSDGWVEDLDDIMLERGVMRAYFEAKLANSESSGKIWHGGYKRMVNQTSITTFHYHPPTAEKPTLCHIRYHVPASMRSTKYPVVVALEFVPALDASEDGIVPATPALITRVLTVKCNNCKGGGAGSYPFCIHGSATLFVMYNLRRPDGDVAAKAYVPTTAALCRWNVPGQGEAYDVEKPIAYMPLTQDDPDKPVKRSTAARSDFGERMNFVAHSPDDVSKNKRGVASRMAALEKLHAILSFDLKGKISASEMQWGHAPDEDGDGI
jgi:hypothetical protein